MIKTKHLGLAVIASTSFIFSGCVHQPDTFSNQHGYYNNAPRVNVSLVSYAYPYYFNRPYYFLNGLYYYGGTYSNGFYNYGHRRFGHGHYYNRGHRYYNGRRYRARNGQNGYYTSRGNYQRSHHYKNVKHSSSDRGRYYETRKRRSHIGNGRPEARHSQSTVRARNSQMRRSQGSGTVRTRHRPVR